MSKSNCAKNAHKEIQRKEKRERVCERVGEMQNRTSLIVRRAVGGNIALKCVLFLGVCTLKFELSDTVQNANFHGISLAAYHHH